MKPILLIGPMGAGKSTIGKFLARQLGMRFEDTDHLIEARTGANIPWIFELEGEDGFRKRETAVLEEYSLQSDTVLATGGGIVTQPSNLPVIQQRCLVVYLYASVKQQWARTEKDKNRPLLQQDNPQQVLQNLFNQRHPIYQSLADITVKTDGRGPKAVADEIRKHLQETGLIK